MLVAIGVCMGLFIAVVSFFVAVLLKMATEIRDFVTWIRYDSWE
jgi:hypothetical protein